ncbi:hypothetical protein BD779DRAFT_1675638 [Infundibulicybe gibba]|nr:hypothetical protein BD779DRAFT_1675638 [Infundibulicybe gibba]
MEDLPVEIVQKIFLELCSPRTTFPLHRDEPRLLITHVCSRWRAIALSTPPLWAKFNVHPSWRDPVLCASIFHAWIFRAAQSALSFEFQDAFVSEAFVISPMITKVVFPVIHHCSFLSLDLDIAMMHQLLTLPPNSLHALKSLTILVQDKTPVVDPTPFATAFEPCPQLHTFSLRTFGGYPEYQPEYLRIAAFNIPWHQLIILKLDLCSIPADESFDIVRRCTSLQQCTIEGLSLIDDLARDKIIGFSHPPTTLPSLHTLCIGFDDWGPDDNHRAFFQALHLPRLRKFHPCCSPYSMFWSLQIFQSVLGDTIQELDLSTFPLPQSLPEMLALVPNLEILWLGDNSHEHPEIMRALGEGTIAPASQRYSSILCKAYNSFSTYSKRGWQQHVPTATFPQSSM